MKKIGVLTFCYEHNYGAVLQCLALSKILESKKLEVEVLRYITESSINDDLRLFNPKKGNIIKQIITAPLNYRKFDNFKKFIENNINITNPITSQEDFKSYVKDFDGLVVGSDQVWNSTLTGKEHDVFLMSDYCSNNTKLYSYAASFGKSNIPNNTKDILKKNLQKYSLIGVREQSGCEIIKEETNCKPQLVLDPTLLYTAKEWNEYALDYPTKEDYVLVYTMEKNDLITKIANEIAKRNNLKIIHFRKEKIFENEINRAFNAGPGEFLTLFKNAKYVITNSFHGLVFSIINNKEFISIAHKERNTRQESLLGLLEINNRIVKSFEEYENIKNKKIDYKKVNQLLENQRKESLKFIDKIVEDINE